MPALKPNTSPIDPNVKIPAAVKAGIAKAEAAQAEFVKARNAEPPPPPEAPLAPIVTEAAPLVAETPPAAPPVAPVAPEVTPQGNELPNWEHQFKSMKGRHDRLLPQVKELGEQVTALQRVIATMNAAPATTVAPAPARLVTPEEEASYGAEFLDVVARRAKEQFAPVEADLRGQIASLNSQIGKVGGSIVLDARSRMLSTFDAQLPRWHDINTDQNFLDWLALPDPYSGVIRSKLLLAAWEQNDTPRALAFFNGFLAEEAALTPAPRVPDAPPGADPVVPAGKVPLETFAAPGRAKSAAGTSPPPEKPNISPRQISQFYVDVAGGKYRGREDEQKRVEAAIFAAAAGGRIR